MRVPPQQVFWSSVFLFTAPHTVDITLLRMYRIIRCFNLDEKIGYGVTELIRCALLRQSLQHVRTRVSLLRCLCYLNP